MIDRGGPIRRTVGGRIFAIPGGRRIGWSLILRRKGRFEAGQIAQDGIDMATDLVYSGFDIRVFEICGHGAG
jgi:hypothetical protein